MCIVSRLVTQYLHHQNISPGKVQGKVLTLSDLAKMQNPNNNKINHPLGEREGLYLVGDVSFTEQKLFRNILSVACLSKCA